LQLVWNGAVAVAAAISTAPSKGSHNCTLRFKVKKQNGWRICAFIIIVISYPLDKKRIAFLEKNYFKLKV